MIEQSNQKKGKAYLVGAGPGDPGLLTLRGRECLGEAQVVLYDRLVNPQLLSYVPPDAELIYAGKGPGELALSQEKINQLLIAKAQEGKVVVRLKGGDPFLFGRGGEEALALVEAGVPFEIVPGVTSALAVPAYAGIPVTHRGLSASLLIATGHEDPTKGESQIDWAKLATSVDTMVLLMGVENLSYIVQALLEHGRPPETPIALIRWGTWPQQETLEGTLGDILNKLEGRDFGPPAVAVVGDVVSLRAKLRWFDERPLFGKGVLVTRARDQASRLSSLLSQYGAQTYEVPAIEILEPHNYGPLDAAIARLGEFHWLIFTSVNGVTHFFGRLFALGRDSRALGNVNVCAIGPATAAALRDYGVIADFVPDTFLSEEIAAGLKQKGIAEARILLPRTDIAPEALAEALSAMGAQVEQVVTYRTVPAEGDAERVKRLLKEGKIHIATFASASTVKNLLTLLDGDTSLLNGVKIACIGPITAKAAQEAGLPVDITAREHTIPGLVKAILEHYETASAL